MALRFRFFKRSLRFLTDSLTHKNPSFLAAARVLQTPELVANILSYLLSPDGGPDIWTLYKCALVNSLWAHEANMKLWENWQCLSGFPALEDLAKIHSDRRQKYANYMKGVSIEIHEERVDNLHLLLNHDGTETTSLSFPRLQNLTLESHFYDPLIFPLLLDSFAQPGLKKLRISVANFEQLTADGGFLQCLQENCTHIRDLSIRQHALTKTQEIVRPNDWDKIQFRISSILEASPLLEKFHCEPETIMSSSSFQILGRGSNLKEIYIRGTWRPSSIPTLLPSAFSALRILSCHRISGDALQLLMPCIKQIEELTIEELTSPVPVWQVIVQAGFENLQLLRLQLDPRNKIFADEVLAITGATSQLHSFEITGYALRAYEPLKAEGFSDTMIETFSRQVPLLACLKLSLQQTTEFLTETSLISLGRNCPMLRTCWMTAKVSWVGLVRNATPDLWSNLLELQIPYSTGEPIDFQIMAEKLLLCMPKLGHFLRQLDLGGLEDLTEAFRSLVISRMPLANPESI